ncbi:hypothetical protein F511_08887 [Dorcoceras hygrometricum]|uniref:Uncharacterized protein n=1 Tax=Dorcoceras hygrometricum TaxID=472368 RepID=A0A2Z7B329_9LAMI|nr:hypothetical protein F511_11063 [Dorcoceras hygrometricum]KZV25942.1 hypothetical protein F511_08887 [Dorcoceras hygrometricum]
MPRRRRNAARQEGDRLQQRPQQETSTRKESAAGDDDSTAAVVSPIPASLSSPSVPITTNLDRFIKSVSPLVPMQILSVVNSNGSRKDSHTFFRLEDVWESFHEWSVYGVGVPLLLNAKDSIEQFYVPYLSGIQLYKDTSRHSSQISDFEEGNDAELHNAEHSDISGCNTRADDESVSGSTAKFGSSRTPFFQYFEYEPPHFRLPLTDKIWEFASQYPELVTSRSCDLLPSSWICVAWYPIYRIPVVPTLQHSEASFLTFYSLSTQSDTTRVHNDGDPANRYQLPVFGLVPSSSGTQELEQESSFLQAAEDWLRQHNIILPDYRFFRADGHYRR